MASGPIVPASLDAATLRAHRHVTPLATASPKTLLPRLVAAVLACVATLIDRLGAGGRRARRAALLITAIAPRREAYRRVDADAAARWAFRPRGNRRGMVPVMLTAHGIVLVVSMMSVATNRAARRRAKPGGVGSRKTGKTPPKLGKTVDRRPKRLAIWFEEVREVVRQQMVAAGEPVDEEVTLARATAHYFAECDRLGLWDQNADRRAKSPLRAPADGPDIDGLVVIKAMRRTPWARQMRAVLRSYPGKGPRSSYRAAIAVFEALIYADDIPEIRRHWRRLSRNDRPFGWTFDFPMDPRWAGGDQPVDRLPDGRVLSNGTDESSVTEALTGRKAREARRWLNRPDGPPVPDPRFRFPESYKTGMLDREDPALCLVWNAEALVALLDRLESGGVDTSEFGRRGSFDTTKLPAHREDIQSSSAAQEAVRRDGLDADLGTHGEDSHFGWRILVLVEHAFNLPIAWIVWPASYPESGPEGAPAKHVRMLFAAAYALLGDRLALTHVSADAGFDNDEACARVAHDEFGCHLVARRRNDQGEDDGKAPYLGIAVCNDPLCSRYGEPKPFAWPEGYVDAIDRQALKLRVPGQRRAPVTATLETMGIAITLEPGEEVTLRLNPGQSIRPLIEAGMLPEPRQRFRPCPGSDGQGAGHSRKRELSGDVDRHQGRDRYFRDNPRRHGLIPHADFYRAGWRERQRMQADRQMSEGQFAELKRRLFALEGAGEARWVSGVAYVDPAEAEPDVEDSRQIRWLAGGRMLAQTLRRYVQLTGMDKEAEAEARTAGLLDAPLFDTPPLEALLDECVPPDDFVREEVELPNPRQHDQPLELVLDSDSRDEPARTYETDDDADGQSASPSSDP